MLQILDSRGLAGVIRVKPATVLAWARRGWIPCLRAGRRPVLFDVEAVRKALDDPARRRKAVRNE
jgi:hypothetical protein